MSQLLTPFTLIWLFSCSYAIWRGGAPERLVAGLFLLALPLTVLLYSLAPTRDGPSWGVLAVDMMLLAALLPIAWRANRLWPITMAGMQLILVLGHVLTLINPRSLPPILYWLTSAFWAYPMLALLVIATVRHRGRVRTIGHEQSWNRF